MMPISLSPEQWQQAQWEIGMIRAEMGEHLPMTAEIQPMFRDGAVLFMLSPNEAVWLEPSGPALTETRKADHG